jgi:class 3 adenylate cyclase
VDRRVVTPPEGKLHPLTLRFVDPELERKFGEERRASLGRGLERAVFFAGILWGVAGIILIQLSPRRAGELTYIVAAMVAANLVGALVLGRTRTGSREVVVAVLNAVAGLAVLTLASVTGLDHHVAAGLILMVIYAFFYTRISFVHAMLAVLPPLVAFTWFVVGRSHGTLLDLFLGWASSGVAGMAGYTLEGRTRQVFHQRQVIESQQLELAREKEKSDRLLANMLPESVAARLREDPSALAESFDEVTVLFADLVGFTNMAAAMPAAELVRLLDGLFSRFDELAVRHGVEKVKTIGDAYMVVGGCPERSTDHVERTVAMGLAMVEELRRFAAERGLSLALRAGIHTGPVVAGVIGTRRFSFDLWGDTVNTASRMESHGVAGRIQVSTAVRDRLGDRFPMEERGPVSVKGKGEMQTFLLIERA